MLGVRERRRGHGRGRRFIGLAVLVGAMGVAVGACGGGGAAGGAAVRSAASTGAAAAGPRLLGAPDRTLAVPATAYIPGGPGRLTVWVRDRPVLLRASPGGRVLAHLGTRTEFDSERTMPVVGRRGGWLAVISAKLANGRVGWVAAAQVHLYRVRYSMRVSLARRRVVVRRDGRVVMRFPVAVGAPGTPTPRGRFAVTDKLLPRGNGPYGCCILALSAHQPNLREGWQGGDRVAIHGTDVPSSVGQAVSNGCLRAAAGDIRRAVDLVPVGTLVTIGA